MREITLNGAPVGPDAFDGDRIALPGLAAEQRAAGGRRLRLLAHRRGPAPVHRPGRRAGLPLLPVRDLRRAPGVRLLRPARPEGQLRAHRHRARRTGRSSPTWRRTSRRRRTARARRWHFPPTPVMPTYITARRRPGRTTSVRDEHDGIPLGVYCRQSLAEYLDADEILEVTKQGFDFFHALVRHPVPVRQVRPALRAGVQRGRDGERRLRHLPRGLHLPVAGHRFRPRGARRDDPARDGAHVVRRPGHHALVGRPVAERVVRHLGRHAGAGRGDQVDVGAGPRSRSSRRPGPTGRTSCPRPTRSPPTSPTSTRSRSTSTASPTPRARRCSSSWSPTSGGRTSSPACASTSREHAWGNATLADLLAALEETSGRDLTAWSAEWLQTAGVNTLRPAYTVDADGRFTAFAVRAGGGRPRTRRCARTASPIGLYDRTDGRLARRDRIEIDVAGAAHRGPGAGRRAAARPGAGQRRRPHLRQDPARRAFAAHPDRRRSATFDRLAARALCWAAAWDMCRDGEMAARDYVRLVLSGISSVADISVVQTLLRQAGKAVRRFADPSWRATGLELLAARCASFWSRRRPGRTPQLAYVRSSPASPSPPMTWRCWPGCSTARSSARRPQPWTPTCAGPARPAGEPRPTGRGADRRRAGSGRHRRGRAARRHLPGGDPHGGGQAGGLGGADRRAS